MRLVKRAMVALAVVGCAVALLFLPSLLAPAAALAQPTDPYLRSLQQQIERDTERSRAYERERELQRAEAKFAEDTRVCAIVSGVRTTMKPGGRVTIFGTSQERFDFDRCMTERGHDLASR